jgi:acyl-CoA dehydrogenase family member 9
VTHPDLFDDSRTLAALVKKFGTTLPHVFLRLKDEAVFVQAQLVHERIADIAIDLYAATCVLSRLDHLLGKPGTNGQPSADPTADPAAGRYFRMVAFRRIEANFAALESNDDAACLAAAKATLAKF